MSQAGYTPISLYFSTTAAAVPVNTNLANGELAINITDGKLYYKDNGGTVRLLASNATSAPVLSFSAGTTGFTPSTATTGAITLAGTLGTANGGTGLTSFTSGGVVYASSTSTLATGSALYFNGTDLAIGTTSPFTNASYVGLTIGGARRGIVTLNNASAVNVAQLFVDSTNATNLYGTTKIVLGSNNGANLLTYDASGNLGLGVTPSAWNSAYSGMQFNSTVSLSGNTGKVLRLQNNSFVNSSSQDVYITTAAASSYLQNAGAHIWYTAPSGTAGTAATFTQTMTLNASGNLGIGTTTLFAGINIADPANVNNIARLNLRNDNSDGGNRVGIVGYNANSITLQSASESTGTANNTLAQFRYDSITLFTGTTATNPTERFRIASTGAFGLSGANYGTSGQVLTSQGSGSPPIWAAGGGGGSVAGSNGQVQFNNSGSFGADGGFFWDNTNKRLSINAGSSPTDTLQVTGRIRMGTSFYLADNSSGPTIYMSPTGSDSTGTGTNANPFATMNKCVELLTKFIPYSNTGNTIILKNGSYTLASVQYFRGFTGGGPVYINAETAGSVTINMNGWSMEFDRNDAEFYISGITFNQPAIPSMFQILDTLKVQFQSNCAINNLTTTGTPGYFNQAIGVQNSKFVMACPLTVTNESFYGAVINIGSGSIYAIQGTISKSGARHGNAAVSIQGNAEGQLQSTINNFAIGVNMGRSHYDAEGFGLAVANGLSCTNCTIGIQLANNGSFKSYYIASFSGTTTPVSFINGWYSGTMSSEYNLLGYTTSVSSSYRLQVNSQIYATSATIATSDGRYKKNVAVIANGLDIVKALRPVQFDWIPHDIHNFDTEHTTVGFIAQEVKEVLAGTAYVDSIIKPHYITREAEEYDTVIITPATEEIIDADGTVISLAAPPVTEKRITKPAVTEEFFGIAEGNLIAILTKAIQEQQVIIETLTARVEALEAK